jgi:predicted helicase
MGNFPAAVMRLAIEKSIKKYGDGIGNSFIQTFFLNNIYGFEVMLPLYVLGYLNLLELIKSFVGVQGAVFQKSPLAAGGNLYLTDTLKNGLDMSIDRQEGAGIGRIKIPVMVILCNPPYSRHSLNKGERILELVKDYLQVKDGRIGEKNIKGLQDDYVKFFRFAQWQLIIFSPFE